jgi:hypothetical protein
MSFSRRQFLTRSGALSASLTAAALFADRGVAGAFPDGGYGPLVADPNGICDLPPGFTYRVLASTAAAGPYPATQLGRRSPAENLGPVPAGPDALGSFFDPSTGRTFLVCNHELTTSSFPVPKTFRGAPVPTYDSGSGAQGGCTMIELDAMMNVVDHRPVLAGTIRNCAGGMTPWGTWLTCEETTSSASASSNRTKDHGYLFEVDPFGSGTSAQPYRAMGRAAHEAVAIDPDTGKAYITEDANGGLLYLFRPTNTTGVLGSLGGGGELLAMKVPGHADFATLAALGAGTSLGGVTFTAAANPDVVALNASFDSATVTRGAKLEGCWWIGEELWFVQSYTSVTGSPHAGAIFAFEPTDARIRVVAVIPAGGATVTLGAQTHALHNPDNIAATPYGGAIWSQDGGASQYLVIVHPNGSYFPFAKNPAAGEWAGAHFSLDGRWLFANQQANGRTLAITGPWTGPEPVVPEAPMSVLLPISGAASIAALIALRQRRMAAAAEVMS